MKLKGILWRKIHEKGEKKHQKKWICPNCKHRHKWLLKTPLVFICKICNTIYCEKCGHYKDGYTINNDFKTLNAEGFECPSCHIINDATEFEKVNEALIKKTKEKSKLTKEKRKKDFERKLKKIDFELEQWKKGFIKFKNKWGTPEQVKKWKIIDIGLMNNFKDYSPFEFEEFIAKLFKAMGYKSNITKKTGDYGMDVIVKKGNQKIGIQVKKYGKNNKVGAVDVQNTLGSSWKYKVDKSIIITTSDFTNQAKEQAKEAPIELWNKGKLNRIVMKYLEKL